MKLSALAILLVCGSVRADETGSIAGRIRGEKGAVVAVYGPAGQFVKLLGPEANGSFAIADLPPGDYSVYAATDDASATRSVPVAVGKVSRTALVLERVAVVAQERHAIAKDVEKYERLWTLLTLDEKGAVMGVELVHPPPHTFDAKAVTAEGMKLRFKALASKPPKLLWKIEVPRVLGLE